MKKIFVRIVGPLLFLLIAFLQGYAQTYSPAQLDSAINKNIAKSGAFVPGSVLNPLLHYLVPRNSSTGSSLYNIIYGGTYIADPDADDSFHYILIPTQWVYNNAIFTLDSTAFTIDAATAGKKYIAVPSLKNDGTLFVIKGAEGTGTAGYPIIPTGYIPRAEIIVSDTASYVPTDGIPTAIKRASTGQVYQVDTVLNSLFNLEFLHGKTADERFDKDADDWADYGRASVIEVYDPINDKRQHAVSVAIPILDPVNSIAEMSAIGGDGDSTITFPASSYPNGYVINVVGELFYELQRGSTATPNDSTIVAATVGNWVAKTSAGSGGSSGIAGHIIAYQDSTYAQQPILQFKGAGVHLVDSSGKTQVVINGYPSPPIGGAVIYVSPDGSDTNGERGNISSPFFSISGAKTVYQSGDVIHVFPGSYTGQDNLSISGQVARYYFSQGADVTFSTSVINATSGSVIARGFGKLSGTTLIFNNSGGIIDMEFDEIDLSSSFYVLTSSSFRFKGRAMNLGIGSDWALQFSSLGHFEVETFTQLNTGGTFHRDNNGVIDFVNTHFIMSGQLQFYQGSSYTNYSTYRFKNCIIESDKIQTLSGVGTDNSFYGLLSFDNTKIVSAKDGIEFLKTELGTEFWFDNVSITSGVGYHSMNATQTPNAQCRPINIRILSGGLYVDKDVVFDVTRPITNLVPGSYATRQDYAGSVTAASRFSSIIVTDEPGTGSGGGGVDTTKVPLDGTAAGRYMGGEFVATGGASINFRYYPDPDDPSAHTQTGMGIGTTSTYLLAANPVGSNYAEIDVLHTDTGNGYIQLDSRHTDTERISMHFRPAERYLELKGWTGASLASTEFLGIKFTNNNLTWTLASATVDYDDYVPSIAVMKDAIAAAGGGSAGDADSLGGVPASGYVLTTRTVNGHALSSNASVTASDVGLGSVDNTSDATKNSATATLTNKTLTSPVINSGSLGSSTVANTQSANDNSTKVSTTAYADLAADNAKVSTGKTYTQSSHGFVAGDVLMKQGGVWAKARAHDPAFAEVLGVVESVTTNTFRLVFSGEITLSGLTTETNYYLSPTTAGAYTATEPTLASAGAGSVSKPVFFSISTTVAIVQIQRGITN